MEPPPDVVARGRGRWDRTTGAEFIRALGDERFDQAVHAKLLDYRIVEAEPGFVAFAWRCPEPMVNPGGIAHGGFLVALLDDATGLAAASRYPRFVPQLTIELRADFLAPVPAGVTHRVEGEVIRAGRTNLVDGRVLSPDGELLTRASGLFQPNRRVIPRDRWEEAGIA